MVRASASRLDPLTLPTSSKSPLRRRRQLPAPPLAQPSIATDFPVEINGGWSLDRPADTAAPLLTSSQNSRRTTNTTERMRVHATPPAPSEAPTDRKALCHLFNQLPRRCRLPRRPPPGQPRRRGMTAGRTVRLRLRLHRRPATGPASRANPGPGSRPGPPALHRWPSGRPAGGQRRGVGLSRAQPHHVLAATLRAGEILSLLLEAEDLTRFGEHRDEPAALLPPLVRVADQ